MTDLKLTVEKVIPAPPRTVFEAWLDPAILARIMRPGETMRLAHAKTDPRPGGRFEIVMRSGEQEIPHSGTYREITPHERLVFSWESAYVSDDSEVTLLFRPEAEGTRLTLTHLRFPDGDSRDSHESGWATILGHLAEALD